MPGGGRVSWTLPQSWEGKEEKLSQLCQVTALKIRL